MSDTPRRTDAQRNRSRILEAASQVLAHEPDATLAHVIEASGLSRATVYRHFSDMAAVRAALIETVQQEGRASLDEHFFEPGLSRGRPAQSTAEVLGAYLRKAFRMDSVYGHVLSTEREPGAELIEEFLPITEAMIRAGQERGEFRTDIDVTLAAKTHLTIVISAARRARSEGYDVDDAVVMVESFLRGLERSPRPIWPGDDEG
ncbi:MAG: TetR/AcrR family transcriptional regulator [Solirubrobacteraceae bacterium]|nr:TetR/AcrR family transcriptional regulator [Patulibacter sp.]